MSSPPSDEPILVDSFAPASLLCKAFSLSDNTLRRVLREHESEIRTFRTPGNARRISVLDLRAALGLPEPSSSHE